MFKKKSSLLLAMLLLLSACSAPAKKEAEAPKQQTETQEKKDKVNLPSQNLMAVTWYQTSAEAKALYTQGYNAAKKSLEEKIKNKAKGEKLAVVLDLDETVLDNSPIQAYYAINGKSYPEGWHEWVMYAKADVVYGAKNF